MKMITGAILLLVAELAFAHTYLIQFPHHLYVSEILIPTSVVAAILGGLMLIWGVANDLLSRRARSNLNESKSNDC